MPNWKKVIVSGSSAILNNITASGNISSSGLLYASLSYDDTPVTDGVVAYDIATGQLYYTGSYGNSGEDTDWYVNNGTLGQINDFVTSSRFVKINHQGFVANSGSVGPNWGLGNHNKNSLVGFHANFNGIGYDSSTATTPGGYTGKYARSPRTYVTAEAWDIPETRIYPVSLTARGTGSGNFGLNEGYPYNYLVFGQSFYYEFTSGSEPDGGGPSDEPQEDTGLGGQLVIDGGITVQNDTRKFSLSSPSGSLPPLTGNGEAPPSIVIRPQGGIFFFETGSTLSSSGSYLATSASARIVYNTSSHHLSIKVGSKQADDLTEVLYISKSGDNPRIGIGVNNPLRAFDFKEVSDTNRGGEILIRGSRTTKGAEPNDEVGRINFIIDSSSYLKVETSGSAAEIIAFADEVDETGIKGSLSFRVSTEKNQDSIEKIRITPDGTKVTGSFTVSGSNSFINIGPAEFSGSVAITSSLEVDGAVTHNSTTRHFDNVFVNSGGRLEVNSTGGASVRGGKGLTIGDLVIPGDGQLRVTDYSTLLGGVHVGGISDPGTDNLLVDGTTTLVGTTIISGSTLNVPNLTAGAIGNYDKLLIVDSSGQVRTLADSLVPFIEVFDGEVPINQTLVMFSGSTGNIANATGVSYNSGFGWTFGNAGSIYDVSIVNSSITSLTAITGSFIGDISAANGSFSGDLTVDGNITANQYIVSSSVTYLTQSFSSGSTIFGDTSDDTHQFTGSLDITGSITASGDIRTDKLILTNAGSVSNMAIHYSTDSDTGIYFPASNNISLQAGGGNVELNLNPDGINSTGNFNLTGNITASGDISASGDLTANNINAVTSLTASGLNYPDTDGNDGQVLMTDGSGVLTFNDVKVYAQVKNISGTTLAKGTPVHATASASPPAGNVSEVIAASASLASTMPATFILDEELANDAEGRAILSGFINGVDTSAFNEGDVVYVGPNGGYTTTKPTGTNLIQNLGIITKVDASNGAGYIYGSGRSNDVPNLLDNQIFFGSGSNQSQQIHISGALDSTVINHITASGNISASGEIETNTISTITTVIASDSATNIDTFNTSSYTGAIYDYTLVDTTVGARAGQFMIAQDNGSVTFTDNSTRHLFDATAPEISGQINGANVEVQVTNGNGYTFKSFVKKL